jgi:hypothetical protein
MFKQLLAGLYFYWFYDLLFLRSIDRRIGNGREREGKRAIDELGGDDASASYCVRR